MTEALQEKGMTRSLGGVYYYSPSMPRYVKLEDLFIRFIQFNFTDTHLQKKNKHRADVFGRVQIDFMPRVE